MKFSIATLSFFSISSVALATNGDIRVGLNAVQAGMANAVTAKPEDAGTIFNNPAGLTSLDMKGMRLDMGFALMRPPRSVNGVKSDSNLFFMPTGAVAFRKSPKLTFGVGFSALAGFGMDVPDALGLPGNQPFVTTKELLKFAPSAAVKVNDKLTVGASLDIYNQSLSLTTPGFSLPQNRKFGFGGTVGAIYKVSDKLQFGGSYSTKGNMQKHEFNTTAGKFSLDLDHPAMASIGVAYEPVDGLVIESDIKRINFSDVRNKIDVERPATYAGPVPSSLNFGWSDQTVYALGIRKKMNEKMTIRAGYNYGKSPIGSEDVDNNLGATAISEKHLTLGLTRKMSKHMSSNIAYTRAFDNEVQSSTSPNRIQMDQHVLNLNLTFTF